MLSLISELDIWWKSLKINVYIISKNRASKAQKSLYFIKSTTLWGDDLESGKLDLCFALLFVHEFRMVYKWFINHLSVLKWKFDGFFKAKGGPFVF